MNDSRPNAAQKAKGKWATETRKTEFQEPQKIHTFRANSGFIAVMTHSGGRRRPFHCAISDPQGCQAVHVNDEGRRIASMEIHLRLRDAKATVQERVLELETAAKAKP